MKVGLITGVPASLVSFSWRSVLHNNLMAMPESTSWAGQRLHTHHASVSPREYCQSHHLQTQLYQQIFLAPEITE